MLCRISGSTVGRALINLGCARTALRDTDPSRARVRARALSEGKYCDRSNIFGLERAYRQISPDGARAKIPPTPRVRSLVGLV